MSSTVSSTVSSTASSTLTHTKPQTSGPTKFTGNGMCYHSPCPNGSEKLALYEDSTLYFSRKTSSVDSETGTIITLDVSCGGNWTYAAPTLKLDLEGLTGTVVTVNDEGIHDELYTEEATTVAQNIRQLGDFKSWSLPDDGSDSD
ncbi:hypothetical protein TrVE_jg9596 [Triparma verrucosa]|uniref:Uncharacterized protein n=1 Tax=Triparma verrucosa TaxID=1606542 RepID=A0A9W7FF03_9STRA|nr:hypothetical protein TrVE_jg9596 [Triparma verrucosa]